MGFACSNLYGRIVMASLNSDSTEQGNVLSPICAVIIRDYLVRQGENNIGDIEVIPSVTSTNDYLLHEKTSNKVAVCIAERQTRGRGRFGHTWWSPPGNLYLSMSYPLKRWERRYEMLGLWLLVAVAKLLERLGCKSVRVKWPNDICVQGKKLGGILVDRKLDETGQRLIVGAGINVVMSKTIGASPPGLAWNDLISIIPDWSLSRNELAAHVIILLRATLTDAENNVLTDLPSAWRQYDAMRDRKVEFTWNRQRNTGIAKGINESGGLVIEINGKVWHLHSTHVSEITL